jgi:WD40 repeat protein
VFLPPSPEPFQTFGWKGSLIAMAVSPDGGVVACGGQDQTVHFWRRTTGSDARMSGYTSKPAALCFDATGTLLATSGSERVTVWGFYGDGPEGTAPAQLDAHTLPVSALAFAPIDRLLLSGGREGGVILWRLGPTGEGTVIGGATLGAPVVGVAWRPDQRAVAATDASGGVLTCRVSR